MKKILIFTSDKKERELFKKSLANYFNLLLTDHIEQAEDFLKKDTTITLSFMKCNSFTLEPIEKIMATYQKNKVFIFEDLYHTTKNFTHLNVLPTPFKMNELVEFIKTKH